MCLAISAQFVFLFSLFLLTTTSCFPLRCHEDESYALLQFKEGFVINKFASAYPFSHPKISSWNAHTNCCSWDGIQCDESTGHVIGINLSSSQLYGSMDANTTLFSLVHLRRLDLADNDFNYSQIPPKIGELSRLRHLNLSYSKFFGEIPQEVSRLSKLLSLDLCSVAYSPIPTNLLHFKISSLRSLIQNSTGLEKLRLNFVSISSNVPDTLTNLTSLQHLSLYHCELYGEFPAGIFHLPNLRYLVLGYNQYLVGKLPDFQSTPLISILQLSTTGFYGTLPSSFGNLKYLNYLSISQCRFSGSIPSSFGNLTHIMFLDLSSNKFKGDLSYYMANLTRLHTLRAGFNEFTTETTSWICKLSAINELELDSVNISKGIPSCLVNLTQLYVLSLSYTNLRGRIPSWIMNLTNLEALNVRANNLQGEIPDSLFKLHNLESLALTYNLLEGEVELERFLKLKMLTFVDLSYNKLSLISRKSPHNISLSQIQVLCLDSSNLVELPNFVQDLGELRYLYLSHNNISIIPSWMWRKTSSLRRLSVSHNSLAGQISPLICNLKFLMHLDLSFNSLSGKIPSCLGNSSQPLEILMLQENKLFGPIPQAYMITSSLRMIDLSHNNLQGQLPRALVNCRMLEYLDVSHNRISDSFPFWLGTLPELKLVALRDNQLYGFIRCPKACSFPKLHIIDLSHNEFTGSLPSEMLQNWKSMKVSNWSQLQYERLWRYTPLGRSKTWWSGEGDCYSFTMFNKGTAMAYERLQQFYSFIAIDFSSNKLSGKIPKVMGDLTGLVLLNLSNNMLTGNIPSSFEKLSNLEALDLSVNILSGMIPQQLTQLTFLSFFNVSFNNLSGPIPQSTQFATFQANSFEANQDLCGIQLLKKCEDDTGPSLAPPSISDGDQDSRSLIEFDWKVVLIGYGGGLLAGLSLGSTFVSLGTVDGLIKRVLF